MPRAAFGLFAWDIGNFALFRSWIDLKDAKGIPLGVQEIPMPASARHGKIDATNRRIDRLVYDVYGLTAEEIKIVEEATSK